MAKKVILGTDIARDAFKTKVNDNFTELYDKDEALEQQINDLDAEVVAHKAEIIHQGKNSTLEATSTNDATSTTNAPLKSAGGLAVAKQAYFGQTVNAKHFRTGSFNEFIITRQNRSLGTLGPNQQLRLVFSGHRYRAILSRMVFNGGRQTDALSSTNELAFELTTIFASGSTTSFEHCKFEPFMSIGFESTNIIFRTREGVPDNLEIIIKNNNIPRFDWGLKIEFLGSETPINLVDVVIENQ